MNTFEMTTYGWSGELSIHTIPYEMYNHLSLIEDVSEVLSSLESINDIPWNDGTSDVDRVDPKIRGWLCPEGEYFYWHDGDLHHDTRPTNNVYCVQVNGKDIDIRNAPLDLFPERSIEAFQNNYQKNDPQHCVSINTHIPTIGFCAYEKGCQGSYSIETTDKEFDISKVTVDILETSHSSFIKEYYYDGKIMEQTGDMEGMTKSIEVNYGLLSKYRSKPYVFITDEEVVA